MVRLQRIYPKSKRYRTKTRSIGYARKQRRKTSKRSIIGSKPVKLYPIRDEFGRFKGYSTKPPRERKPKAHHLVTGKKIQDLQMKLGNLELRMARGEITQEGAEKVRKQILPVFQEEIKKWKKERGRAL